MVILTGKEEAEEAETRRHVEQLAELAFFERTYSAEASNNAAKVKNKKSRLKYTRRYFKRLS